MAKTPYIASGRLMGTHFWGIVLAGGEGKRLQEYLKTEHGLDRPKQFCAIIGRRSMLRHTIDRASTMIEASRLLTVINRRHLSFALEDLYDRTPGTVIPVPFNCETGPSILLALLHIHTEDPHAIVVIFPSDHFILEEERFMDHVRSACSFVSSMPGFVVALGIVPDSIQAGYGWIEKGPLLHSQGPMSLFRTNRFWEKPGADMAARLFAHDWLWNTMTLAGTASKFLRLFSVFTPEVFKSFKRIRESLGTPSEQQVSYQVFRNLSSVNFSRSVLERSASHLGVLPVRGVTWSDWGDEQRVRTDLQRLAATRRPQASLSNQGSQNGELVNLESPGCVSETVLADSFSLAGAQQSRPNFIE